MVGADAQDHHCTHHKNTISHRLLLESVGGTTPDTHGRPHGLRPQGRPSPQDEALWGMTLLDVSCKTPGRYP